MGFPDTRRSMFGYRVFLGVGDSLVSWLSKLQTIVSMLSAEVEYRWVVNVAAKCCWM